MSLRLLPLLALSLPALAAPIKVAVIGGNTAGTSADVADQLNDDTWFDFDADLLSEADITSSRDLDGYDVVVIGSSGQGSTDQIYATAVATAVQGFNNAGGGVVSSSWMSYEDPNENIDAFVPIDQSMRNRAFCNGPTSVDVDSTIKHPVTDGIADFTDSTSYWDAPGPADAGAIVLASCATSKAAVTVLDSTRSHGRQVYLGGIYFGLTSYNNTGLRSGAPDRLLEQAVAWAYGDCDDVDKDGSSTCDNDCDDTDPLRFPGSDELCDGIDNDCDEVVPADEADVDEDGARICDLDCDDDDPDRFPGNPEVCDGIDNDCDEVLPADESDADADGFSTCEGDCDDADADNFPGNAEVCDEADNDCDTIADNGLPTEDYWPDGDGDGWGDANASGVARCMQPADHAERGGDCDDGNAAINPGATDVAENGIDEDCDGADAEEPDEGCNCSTGAAGGWMWLMLAPALLIRRRRR